MSLPRYPLTRLCCLALAWSGSCAVFPDQATLPNPSSLGGTDSGTAASAGAGDEPAAGQPSGGVPGASGGVASSGSMNGGSVNGGAVHGGSGPTPDAGAGGDAGGSGVAGAGGGAEPGCSSPVEETVAIGLDTWIEEAKPSAQYGSDLLLSVVGGDSERRALFQVTLPVVPDGAVLLAASFELTLQANADTSSAARELTLQRLLHEFSESKANWEQFAAGGANAWKTGGGDFVLDHADATLAAKPTSSRLAFDLMPVLSPVFASELTLPLILRELGSPPQAPAELSFMSRSSAAADAPRLRFRYCPP